MTAKPKPRSAWRAVAVQPHLGQVAYVETPASRRKAVVAAHKPGHVLLVWQE